MAMDRAVSGVFRLSVAADETAVVELISAALAG